MHVEPTPNIMFVSPSIRSPCANPDRHDCSRYFQAMLDCGNDVSLTSEEFVKAAKQCLSVEVEAQSGRGVSPDVAQVLKGLSQYLIKNKVEAKEAFDRQDRQRIGRIEPREMLQLFRTSLRQPPSDVALRHVSVQLYLLFMNGDGTASFRELVKVSEQYLY